MSIDGEKKMFIDWGWLTEVEKRRIIWPENESGKSIEGKEKQGEWLCLQSPGKKIILLKR